MIILLIQRGQLFQLVSSLKEDCSSQIKKREYLRKKDCFTYRINYKKVEKFSINIRWKTQMQKTIGKLTFSIQEI